MYLTMIGAVTCGMSLSGPIFACCTAARNPTGALDTVDLRLAKWTELPSACEFAANWSYHPSRSVGDRARVVPPQGPAAAAADRRACKGGVMSSTKIHGGAYSVWLLAVLAALAALPLVAPSQWPTPTMMPTWPR